MVFDGHKNLSGNRLRDSVLQALSIVAVLSVAVSVARAIDNGHDPIPGVDDWARAVAAIVTQDSGYCRQNGNAILIDADKVLFPKHVWNSQDAGACPQGQALTVRFYINRNGVPTAFDECGPGCNTITGNYRDILVSNWTTLTTTTGSCTDFVIGELAECVPASVAVPLRPYFGLPNVGQTLKVASWGPNGAARDNSSCPDRFDQTSSRYMCCRGRLMVGDQVCTSITGANPHSGFGMIELALSTEATYSTVGYSDSGGAIVLQDESGEWRLIGMLANDYLYQITLGQFREILECPNSFHQGSIYCPDDGCYSSDANFSDRSTFEFWKPFRATGVLDVCSSIQSPEFEFNCTSPAIDVVTPPPLGDFNTQRSHKSITDLTSELLLCVGCGTKLQLSPSVHKTQCELFASGFSNQAQIVFAVRSDHVQESHGNSAHSPECPIGYGNVNDALASTTQTSTSQPIEFLFPFTLHRINEFVLGVDAQVVAALSQADGTPGEFYTNANIQVFSDANGNGQIDGADASLVSFDVGSVGNMMDRELHAINTLGMPDSYILKIAYTYSARIDSDTTVCSHFLYSQVASGAMIVRCYMTE